MFFHSWLFACFFLVFYPVYWFSRRSTRRDIWLFLCSYIFYGAGSYFISAGDFRQRSTWTALLVALIFYSTLVDYYCVRRMARTSRRRRWLAVSLVNNLGMLGLFKYAAFVVHNTNSILGLFHFGFELTAPSLILPIGISFYTFQSMSYTIDFYRGQVDEEPDFIRFAAFVSLFPQLVAGPIERASELLPQLRREPTVTWDDIAWGGSLFLVGLFKKVALANYFASYADRIYNNPSAYESPALIMATIAFAWQIYFDFSGYTDMARGVGRAMGIRLMLNFRHPYLATGLSDFWSRWHISLSTWFRDYVYIPLGGNRHGPWMLYRNLFLTMVISGIWHGANWTYVIWGILHGGGACLLRSLEHSTWYRQKFPTLLKQLMVFAFVCFAWIFFRAADVADALTVVRGICRGGWQDPGFPLLGWALLAAVWSYEWLCESRYRTIVAAGWFNLLLAAGMILYLIVMPGGGDQAFIYFQF